MGFLIQFLCFILCISFIIDRKSIIKSNQITMSEGEMQTEQIIPHWKAWLLPRPHILSAQPPDSKITLCSQIIAALTNPYNFLFASLHSLCCIPQALLGSMWLKEYLEIKFIASPNIQMDKTLAAKISVCSNIGAAVSSLIFGWIGRKYQRTNPYIYRILICIGFVLWSCALLIIYVPASYHHYWNLFLFSFISGSGLGAVSIIFAAIRMVNDEAKSADIASGLVSSICMAVMFVSYQITGKIFAMLQTEALDGETSVEEFNIVFYYVVISILLGFILSFAVPKNM